MRVLFEGLASLRTTVGLLVVSMVLVFAATVAQAHLGIWEIQEKYFRSIWVTSSVPGTGVLVPVFPGGYLIGGLLLANLACSYVVRWDASWRKMGLHLVHAGVVTLLIGELLTGILRRESTLRLAVGEARGYSESVRTFELAISGANERPGGDREVALNATQLSQRGAISAPELPFTISVIDYLANAAIEASDSPGPADRGPGVGLRLVPKPRSPAGDESGLPGAYVRISAAGANLGTWLVSPLLPDSQTFSVAGREWTIVLRPERTYLPVTLALKGITNDLYPGTDIPKNFVSQVRVSNPSATEYRDVTIAMNEPLRIGDFTFYQYQMNLAGQTSVLEVVENPGWRVPYVACLMVGIGMAAHFSLCLLLSSPRRASSGGTTPNGLPGKSPSRELIVPCVAVCLAGGFVVSSIWPRGVPPGADVAALGRLAVLDGGRIKPLDSVARSTLLKIQGRQDVRLPETGESLVADPDAWVADVLFDPDRADTYPTFLVESKEVRDVLGLGDAETRITYPDGLKRTLAMVGFAPARRNRFSFAQVKPRLGELERQARIADALTPDSRSPYQRKLIETRNAIELYLRLKSSVQPPDLPDFYSTLLGFESVLNPTPHAREADVPGNAVSLKAMADRFSYMEKMGNLRLIAPSPGGPPRWRSVGGALADGLALHKVDDDALEFARIGHAWRVRDSRVFNMAVASFGGRQRDDNRGLTAKVLVESWFNHAEPFYTGMVLFGSAFLLGVFSWLRSPLALGKSAFWVLGLAWVVTTLGIAARMWIESRPPVTNLYSSALFVGWGSVGLCLVLEAKFRNSLGSVAGSMIGFATLLIAHHLSLTGDTMEMMRAVLDSNFWLATHVVVVTLGYAATFLAGFLASIYIARGLVSRSLDSKTGDELSRMVYGVICFATLFSLIGTVLGGIWADQSWGRFWGWDPKENGALLIVLWNTAILHARSAGLVESRGLMVMAVLGNIVTSWSWFGVNMLGIGLHSYGFMEAAFYWLIAFVAIQLAIACAALLPLDRSRSFSARGKL